MYFPYASRMFFFPYSSDDVILKLYQLSPIIKLRGVELPIYVSE